MCLELPRILKFPGSCMRRYGAYIFSGCRFRRIKHMLDFGQNSAVDCEDRAHARLIYS